MNHKNYQNIDEYISDFPENVAKKLTSVRNCLKKAVPAASENISYNMPAFRYNKKVLVYFAAFKHHIGFYALPGGNVAFQKELAKYKTGKGSIQFPLNEEIPLELIREIVLFRVEEIDRKK